MGSKKRQDASKKGTEKSSKKDTTQKSQPSTPSNNSKRKSESAKDTSQTAGSSTGLFVVLLILGTLTAGSVYVYINNIGDSQIILGNFRESIEASFTSIFKSTSEKQTAKQPDKKQTTKQADKKQTKKDNAAEKDQKPTRPSTQESEASNKAKESKPYAKASITNSADQNIHKELDTADDLVQRKPNDAIKKYDALLQRYPQSPRAIFGKAEALSRLAELERSNRFLEQSINQYQKVLDVLDVPDELFKKAARTCRDKMQFRGWMGKAVKVMQQASLKFFTDNALRNELGVAYLMMGRNENARGVFQQVVDQEPHNGYALVHLAFVVKTMDLNYEKAIPMFIEGLESGDEGTDDGRFYFHLGEALQRLNRTEEAYEWYQKGADRGHFKSAYQRSLYNINSLTSQAWWDPQKTKYHTYIKMLESNWKTIRDEGLANMDEKKGSFLPEEENLLDTGDWKQFTLFQQGRKNEKNCKRAPKTCALIDKVADAKGCKRGQVKFSIMSPGVHVWPHCGPTNCRIRAHLGLVIPPGPKIRVADDTREWIEGKFIMFDDSFEHEVWHEGSSYRLVLIVDFWHPELTEDQKYEITPI